MRNQQNQAILERHEYMDHCLSLAVTPCEWQLHLKPRPYALSRIVGRRWMPGTPDFRIFDPSPEGCEPAMQAFRADLPTEFIQVVESFQSHQWQLFRLLHEGKTCMELAQMNPVLAYCLANNMELSVRNPESRISALGKLCLNKQRALVKWLGFPDAQSTVRLFQRILPAGVNPSSLRMFRTVLNEGHFDDTLCHLNQINAGVIALLTNKNIFEFVTPALLMQVADREDEQTTAKTADLLFETASMIRMIECFREIKRPVFNSIKSIIRAHDALVPQYNEVRKLPKAARRGDKKSVSFQSPPLNGTDAIIPITNQTDLIEEGANMHHCVAVYDSRIDSGGVYVYRVIKPERATLAIRRRHDNTWECWQLAGKCNAPVTPETRQMVNKWIAKRIQMTTTTCNI